MGLRPAAARWFELLTPRDQLVAALDCLAASGAVELQTHSQTETQVVVPDLDAKLAEYEELVQRFGAVWPAPQWTADRPPMDPSHTVDRALADLGAWQSAAEGRVLELERLQVEILELERLVQVLGSARPRLPNLAHLSGAGPFLAARLYRMPDHALPQTLSPSIIVQWFDCGGVPHLLATGPTAQVDELEERLVEWGARPIAVPAELPPDPADAAEAVCGRIDDLKARRTALTSQLEALHVQHRVAGARGDLEFSKWLARCAPALPATEHFAWITGWTSDLEGTAIRERLGESQVNHVFRFTEAPPGAQSPVVLRNPAWIRPFETFARLMGVPSGREADPSAVVALVAPLLFGYMFGDVGQGAVLLAVGLVVRRRFPVLGLLVPGGLFTMGFGLLYGSVFSMKGLIPPLWISPLKAPLTILEVTVVGGVVVLSLGFVLDLLQAVWRRQVGRWLVLRASLVLAWLGVLGAIFTGASLWLTAAGAVIFVAGRMAFGPRTAAHFAGSLGELV
jgi:V/A-type H+/Na+-transporting ATPase subunit I